MEQVRAVLRNQFGAAIEMLQRAGARCPDDLWDDRSRGAPFWHIAYHTLFYLDLYLSASEEAFQPPAFHLPNSNFLREMPFPPYQAETPARAYRKEDLLAYLEQCRAKCLQVISDLGEKQSGEKSPFPWLDFSVGDLLVYNLRHVQHHVGQLNLMLRWQTGSAPGWVGVAGRPPMDEGKDQP